MSYSFNLSILQPKLYSYEISNSSNAFEIKGIKENIEELRSKASKIQGLASSATFHYADQEYIIKTTRGEGSCALHALLGEEIEGVYRFPGDDKNSSANAKSHYCDTLRKGLQSDRLAIKNIFISMMQDFLSKSSKQNIDDRCARMLFNDTEEGRKFISGWMDLENHYKLQLENAKCEEGKLWVSMMQKGTPFFDLIMEEMYSRLKCRDEQLIREALRAEPKSIVNIIDCKIVDYLELLSPENRKKIQDIRGLRNCVLGESDNAKREFILTEKVINHYVNTVKNPAYYLDTHEVELAAHLFNKKVQNIIKAIDGVIPSGIPTNEKAPGEWIIILQESAHFSRCVINPSLKQETRCASEETPNRRGHSPHSERGAPLLKARATRKIDLAKPQQVGCHLFEARINKTSNPLQVQQSLENAIREVSPFILGGVISVTALYLYLKKFV